MTDKTLYERMREAAGVLMEVAERDTHWFAESAALFISGIYNLADKWEREDAEKAAADEALDAEVDELAQVLRQATYGDSFPWGDGQPAPGSLDERTRDLYRKRARAVIDAGWTRPKPC